MAKSQSTSPVMPPVAETNGHAKKNGTSPSPNGSIGNGIVPPEATPPKAETPSEGREANGRFAKGNKGGPGNPFARKVAKLRSALLDSVSEQDVKDVVAMLLQQSKAGDTAAAKLLLAYTVGTPATAVDVDSLDVHEFKLLESHPSSSEVLRALVDTVPATVAAQVVRDVMPNDATAARAQIFGSPNEEEIEEEEIEEELGLGLSSRKLALARSLDEEQKRRRRGRS
jgi:hypothetical protein